jgi:hypothetical protein
VREVIDPTACKACLDSRQCWVCLGVGTTETHKGQRVTCTACDRSGVCRRCAPIPEQRTA